ncbi:unnamed protein product [Urochloa decumbens]|uniref:Transposase MuDR plant domain-containing protein n=1 Tax=Urochloa decumbens TaxID=240449 RepID=A0ABC9EKI7_9POAL
MHQSEIPDGIDKTNAYKVVIDVSSFSTIEDGRSVYKKGRTLEWWVDSEEYSIIDMEKDVAKYFGWASNQEPNFWYVSPHSCQTVRLATDQELLNLLRASELVKFIMTIDRCVHVDDSQVIDEGNEPGPMVPYQVVVAEFEDQEWADDPDLGVTAAGPERVEEEEKEHYMEVGVDPDADDPIGVDEEWRYFKKQQKVHRRENGENETGQKEKKQKVYEGADPDVVPSDEATQLRDAAYVAHTTYDRENPEIKAGSTFVDKDAFKLIIKQYAIKREFQTFVEHSDKSRYRAKCADSQCDWKIYAKKLLGCPTFMVVSISEEHTF